MRSETPVDGGVRSRARGGVANVRRMAQMIGAGRTAVLTAGLKAPDSTRSQVSRGGDLWSQQEEDSTQGKSESKPASLSAQCKVAGSQRLSRTTAMRRRRRDTAGNEARSWDRVKGRG